MRHGTIPAQIGFTQLRVADYLFFAPPVPSSSWPTHVTYVWDSATFSMSVYVNGTLAGTTVGVSESFVMPAGQGWLGSNSTGGEGMVGTIYRVTVYSGLVAETAILRHANAFMAAARPPLNAYDTAIAADATGGLKPVARLLAPAPFTGVGGVAFDYGATSDDATFEFILEGDPSANVSAFLAVGTNSLSSLRYEVWGEHRPTGLHTGRRGGLPIHAWRAVSHPGDARYLRLECRDPDHDRLHERRAGWYYYWREFRLRPCLSEWACWAATRRRGTESMVGTIHRVTVYDSALSADVVLRHANTFWTAPQPPDPLIRSGGRASCPYPQPRRLRGSLPCGVS